MFKKIYEDDISLHSGIPKIYSHLKNKVFEEWEIPPWEVYIDSNKLLGEGTWAKVYLAEWRKTTVVAKILKNSFDLHAKQLIIKEFKNMTKMHHPNIVQLFGYIEEPFIIIMEYFPNGDLFKNLNKLSMNLKVNITKDILKGLIYIHKRKPYSLIHRDIKPRNILLTNSFTAKISDFGLSTFSIEYIINQNNEENNIENNKKKLNNIKYIELTNDVGTNRYMAPEVKNNQYNYKIDIYSCGILLYELFYNKLYYDSFKWNNLSTKLKELIIKMTNEDPNDRPCADRVLNLFNNIIFNKYKIFFLI